MLLANRKPDYSLDLIAESIFLDAAKPAKSSSSGRHHKHANSPAQTAGGAALTLTQEFQLVIALCDFFAERTSPSSSAISNALFLSLFGTGAGAAVSARPRVLAKLVSTAISGRLVAVLSAAGTWMQQMGPTSGCCTELARRIVDDFITFAAVGGGATGGAAPVLPAALVALPEVAPRFTVNLITAISELYLVDHTNGTAPPVVLLHVFTGWLTSWPLLCVGVLSPPALPAGAIAMPMMTPLVGLIRWCVLAPMCTSSAAAAESATGAAAAEAAAYSRLHLGVLQSLAHSQPNEKTVSSASQPNAISALHLGQIVTVVKQMSRPMATDEGGAAAADDGDSVLQASLERLAQSVQLALAARCVTGNVTQLMCRLETLPRNPLLQIVIRATKASL